MANKRFVTSTGKNVLNLILDNSLANFVNREASLVTVPSLLARAKAIYNKDKVYTVEETRLVNGDELT